MEQDKARSYRPIFFSSCYVDDLIVKLWKENFGCFFAGIWMGASSYCYDVALLAPNRQALQKMVAICEEFRVENNLVFSTHPNLNMRVSKI